jgi:hypothetical protein
MVTLMLQKGAYWDVTGYRYTMPEVDRCDTQQGQRIAFAFARTSLFGALWQATVLGSFLAPPDQIALARSVLLQSIRSFRLSPQWVESQKKMDEMAIQYQRARQAQRVQG